MMRKSKILWSSILIILLFITVDFDLASAESYHEWKEKTDVDPNHDWTITFSEELDEATINSKNIYIQYNGEVLEDIQLLLGENHKSIKVEASKKGYKENETYILYIEKDVKSSKGEELNKPIKMKFTVGKTKLSSKLLIKVRGTETPEELWALLDQSPYMSNFSDELLIRHKVSDELSNEIYDLFGAETEFSYYFYLGRLSHLGYRFTANEQMYSVLKNELISILGAPYENEYGNNSEYFLEWSIYGEGNEYGYGRVVLHLSENGLSLTQVTL